MVLKFNGFGVAFFFTLGVAFHHTNGQFFENVQGLNGHSLEKAPVYAQNSDLNLQDFPEYLNIFRQLTDNSQLASRNVPALRTKFDPKSLRVSRVAEAPTRPPPLDPMEQMRLQQEYADRIIREQQRVAHGLGRARPTQPPQPTPAPAPVVPFKPFPIYFNKDPAAQYGFAQFDPASGPNYNDAAEDSLESEEVPRYRPRTGYKKSGVPKKTSYAYDERYFR